MSELMIGVNEVQKETLDPEVLKVNNLVSGLWKMGPYGRRALREMQVKAGKYPLVRALRAHRKSVYYCQDLAMEFKMVVRDESVKRLVKAERGKKLEIPLIFVTKLPAEQFTEISVSGYTVKARTPNPTKEAAALIAAHRKRFNWLECWWVPNDVLVEKIPNPDPILVGAIQTPFNGVKFFELTRWIDEVVESQYWFREGY